ncbi:MAG TPA: hypothetical protein VLV87_09870 [Gammaproteobacteria bacterium]|nr:hypothetical protein [Gammaproteobacteria bacterium]
MKTTKKSATRTSKKASRKSTGFSSAEREAMRDYIREKKAEARGGKVDGEKEVLAKIAKLPPADRALAKKVHELIKIHAPELTPKTWYGMPAYAKDGKTICYFQGAHKFKARYATLGFSDKAALDDGDMWPVVFALKQLGASEEARIIALLKKAVG